MFLLTNIPRVLLATWQPYLRYSFISRDAYVVCSYAVVCVCAFVHARACVYVCVVVLLKT